jgi:transcriptional regulator with XRE-family HTH domain
MNSGGSLWTSPRVRAALARDDVGAVIRIARRAADLNQTELGARCGYSASTISRIERGLPPCQDIHVRRRIAKVLGIPGPYLGLATADEGEYADTPRVGNSPSGMPAAMVGATDSGRGDPVRRRYLLSGFAATAAAAAWPALPSPAHDASPTGTLADVIAGNLAKPAPATLGTLTRSLAAARDAFAACRYDVLADRLVSFIATAVATHNDTTDHQREQITLLLSTGYRLASELCVKRNDDALGWVFADRALTAARDSGNPAGIARASRSVAIAMRRAGHYRDAVHVLSTNALQLQPTNRPTDTTLAVYGSLLCTAAYSSAQSNDRGQAVTLIDEADEAARRLTGPTSAGDVTFSPTNVAIYKIGIFTTLGDSAAALSHAGKVDVRAIDTLERYARFCLDTARAWEQHGRPDRATHALEAAERRAPEELRRPSSYQLINRLLYAPSATPSGLRSLAHRVGALS